jgi:hypothetical protein
MTTGFVEVSDCLRWAAHEQLSMASAYLLAVMAGWDGDYQSFVANVKALRRVYAELRRMEVQR